MRKAEGEENIATVGASKAKEENLEVAGRKCWRGKWIGALDVTGEIFNKFPIKVIFDSSDRSTLRNCALLKIYIYIYIYIYKDRYIDKIVCYCISRVS